MGYHCPSIRLSGIFILRSVIATLLVITASAPGFAGSTAKEQADKAEARRDAITELSFIDAITLEEIRETCAEGRAIHVKQAQEARGNGFPEVHEICRAVVDAATKRDLVTYLYGSLAVRELGIGRLVQSEATLAAVQNGEPAKVAIAIRTAAAKGATSFKALTDKVQPLRPELAYDAGHWYGQLKPEAFPTLSPEVQEQAARACYAENPSATIVLNGMEVPATKACFIVGANAGKKFATETKQTGTIPGR